jgi:hypothetical protein
MKTLKCYIALLVMALPLQLYAGNNIVAEGWMTHDMPLMAAEDPGLMSCPGGMVVLHPNFGIPVCSPGANIHVRDMILTAAIDGSSDYVIGTGHIMANINWDEDGEGPYGGDFSIDVDAYDFTWVGTWTGKRKSQGDEWISTLKGNAYAIGPDAPPYQLKFYMTYTSKWLYPVSYEMLNWLLGTNFTGPEGVGTYLLKRVD